MALSDPMNVQIGLARKNELLKRLAAQMAAKGGVSRLPGMVRSVGGRAQGTGSQFASAVNLRTSGPARVTLPFNVPANRPRPAGFDPDQSGGNMWAAPQVPAVIPSGPPAGGGGSVADTPGTILDSAGNVVTNPTPNQQTNYDTPDPTTGVYAAPPDATFGNGVSLENGFGTNSSPLNQTAPDPYTLMADAQMQRIIRGRLTPS